MSVLVIAEQRGGTLNRATWEAIAAAQQAGGPLRVAVAGEALDAVAGELAAADCERVIAVEHQALREYTADGFALALSALIEQERRPCVLPHTQTRDFAPALRLVRPGADQRRDRLKKTAIGSSTCARCSG